MVRGHRVDMGQWEGERIMIETGHGGVCGSVREKRKHKIGRSAAMLGRAVEGSLDRIHRAPCNEKPNLTAGPWAIDDSEWKGGKRGSVVLVARYVLRGLVD